jgi:phage terminase large subunit-like protein
VPHFRNQNKLHFIAHTLEPIIKVGRLYVHKRVAETTPFLDELQAFPRAKQDDCIDATSEAISHLPELAVDISKVAKIHNPLSPALQTFSINKRIQ